MKIVGSTELKTSDLGDSLQFVITRSLGWTEVAFEVILIGGFSFYAWRQSSAILTICVVLAIVGVMIPLTAHSKTASTASFKAAQLTDPCDPSWIRIDSCIVAAALRRG